jgi:hypothetical protein
MRRSVPLHPTDYGYGIPPTKQAFYDTLFTWIPFFRGFSDICGIKDGEYTNGAPEPRGVDSFALHHGISPALHCPCLCDTDDSFFTQIRTFADTVWRPAAEFLLTADYYSLIPPARTRCGWRAYAFHEPQTDKGFVHVIRSDQNKEDTQNLFLRFLTPNHTYRFHNPETGHSFFVDGGSATQSGIRFDLEQRSGAIWFFAPTEGQ